MEKIKELPEMRRIMLKTVIANAALYSAFSINPIETRAQNLSDPYIQCGIDKKEQEIQKVGDKSTVCESLRKLSTDLDYSRECDLHESGIVNMTFYDSVRCRSMPILQLRKALMGAYPSTLLAPIRFPEGSERLNFYNPQQEEESKSRFSKVFNVTFAGKMQVNGKEQTVKETEATFFVRDFCRGIKYALFEQILLKDVTLAQYAKLYPASCSQQSKLKYFASPTVSLSF